MGSTQQVSEALAYVERLAAALLMGGLILIIALQVFTRYVLGAPILWTEELARYALIWMTAIGAAALAHERGHIGLGLGRQPGTSRVERFREVAVIVVTIAVTVTLVVGAVGALPRLGGTSAALRVPMRFVYLSLPVGLGLWTLHELVALVATMRRRGPSAEPQDAASLRLGT